MNIKHDRSLIGISSEDFIQHGLAFEDLHSIRVSFIYSDKEKEENKAFHDSHSSEEWSMYCNEGAKMRSNEMRSVMEAIAKEFICYQYEEDCGVPYSSDKWDLFFWCNDLYNTTGGKLSGRDYSYFTLTFNETMTADQRIDICNRVLQFLVKRFVDHDHLSIVIQYKTTMEEKKIVEAAKAILPSLIGKKCSFGHMDGKIVQTDLGTFFMKKYARSKGYKLSDVDVLRLGWKLGVA